MKTFLIVLFVLIGAIIFGYYAMPDAEFSVEEPDTNDAIDSMAAETEVLEDGTYRLVSADSTMQWQGRRPLIEGYFDNGVIEISGGAAVVDDGAVTEGEVVVDMTSITAESTGRDTGESMLTNHLRSEDWFDAENYPESRFVLTSYEERENGTMTVTGELTIKDITAPVTFPAVIVMRDGRLIVEATEIELDRTVWDIRYQSGSFFSDLGERLIDDIFTLTFTAVFEPITDTKAGSADE